MYAIKPGKNCKLNTMSPILKCTPKVLSELGSVYHFAGAEKKILRESSCVSHNIL